MRSVLPFLLVLSIALFAQAASLHENLLHKRSPSSLAVNCTTTIERGKLCTSNGTYITLQGHATNDNDACFAPDVTSRPASVFKVQVKKMAHLRDAQAKFHRGRYCDILVPDWYYPIKKGDNVKLYLPLTNATIIKCDLAAENATIPLVEPSAAPSSSKATKSAASASSASSSASSASHKHSKEHKSKTTTTATTTTTTTHHHPTTTTTTTTHKPTTTHHTTTHHTTTTTTTTTHKPTHTSSSDDDDDDDDDSSSSSSSGGSWVDGEVTFFTPNQGACGWWDDDDSMIAALGPDLYGDMDAESKYCGRKIEIEGPKGNTITVKVADACPPCEKEHLDLSPAAFAKLGEFDTGVLDVKWKFV